MKGRMEMQTFKRFAQVMEKLEALPFCYAIFTSKCDNEGGLNPAGPLYEFRVHLDRETHLLSNNEEEEGYVEGILAREFTSFAEMVAAVDDLLPMLRTLAQQMETDND